MTANLLPCPFCGSRVSLIFHEGRHYPGCGDCDYTAEFDTEAEAVAWWNTRPSQWIPCSERMPEPGKYLVFRSLRGFTGEVATSIETWIYYAGDGWGTASFVTHWMPLPPAPEAAAEFLGFKTTGSGR